MIAKGVDQNILGNIKDIDLLYKYFNIKDVPICIPSPLRVDKKPSFVFYSKDGFKIKWKDLAKGDCGGIIDLLMLVYQSSFNEIILKIQKDFDNVKPLKDYKIELSNEQLEHNISIKTNNLQVKIREWKAWDLEYWKSQGIDKLLKISDIYPISHFFVNKDGKRYNITADKYAYCYVEFYNNKTYLKVYQPFNKDHKWINRMGGDIWNLYNKLPQYGNNLIITSSRKDSLTIWENTGIYSISPQAESIIPKKEFILSLKQRFKNIYVLYDNDYNAESNWGRELGKKICEMFDLIQIEIPDYLQSKDSANLYENKGKKVFKSVILNLIKK